MTTEPCKTCGSPDGTALYACYSLGERIIPWHILDAKTGSPKHVCLPFCTPCPDPCHHAQGLEDALADEMSEDGIELLPPEPSPLHSGALETAKNILAAWAAGWKHFYRNGMKETDPLDKPNLEEICARLISELLERELAKERQK